MSETVKLIIRDIVEFYSLYTKTPKADERPELREKALKVLCGAGKHFQESKTYKTCKAQTDRTWLCNDVVDFVEKTKAYCAECGMTYEEYAKTTEPLMFKIAPREAIERARRHRDTSACVFGVEHTRAILHRRPEIRNRVLLQGADKELSRWVQNVLTDLDIHPELAKKRLEAGEFNE